MKRIKVSFDTWVQLLGMLGVLGGLVFVGLEMRQTQRIAVAGQVQARAEMAVERILAPIEGNMDFARLQDTNNLDYENLSDYEKLMTTQIHAWRRVMLENNFYQYEVGLFAEDYWEQSKARIQNWWNNCELRPAGKQVASFQEYLNSLPDNCAD